MRLDDSCREYVRKRVEVNDAGRAETVLVVAKAQAAPTDCTCEDLSRISHGPGPYLAAMNAVRDAAKAIYG